MSAPVPSVSQSMLKLEENEKTQWLALGTGSACVELSRTEMDAILHLSHPALNTLQARLAERMNPSSLERDIFILALKEQKGGDIEFDQASTISTGEGNGAYVGAYKWISFNGTPLDMQGPVYAAMSADGFWNDSLGWENNLKDATLVTDFAKARLFGLLMGTGVCVLSYSAGVGCADEYPPIDAFFEVANAAVSSSDGSILTGLSTSEQEQQLSSIFEELLPNPEDIKSVLPALTAIYEKAVVQREAFLAHDHSKQPFRSTNP